MLFERVYLHHKTRAAERIAMAILATLDLHPADLMYHDDSLFGRFGSLRFPEIAEDVALLEQRRLPRRASAVSYGFLVEQAPAPLKGRLRAVEQDGWDAFEADLRQGSSRDDLTSSIEAEYARIAETLGKGGTLPTIRVDAPPERPAPDDSQFMVIVRDDTLAPARSFSAEAAAHPHNAPETYYVFASGTQEDLELVNVATELAIHKRYGLVIGRATADYAKVDFKNVQSHKRVLEARDTRFFGEAGALRPRSQWLRLGTAPARVEALGAQFQSYSLASVDGRRIEAFLDQFPERLVRAMLSVLESIRYLDRDTLGRSFIDFIRRDGECVLVPLTSSPEKSASHIAYYFGDHGSPPPVFDLKSALASGQPIVFYDDVLISGSQARSVLRTWFGEQPELDEELTAPLSESERDAIREATTRFRFVYAEEPELEAFGIEAERFGLSSDAAAAQHHTDLGLLSDVLGDDAEDLAAFLREVGTSLLMSTKHVETPEKWTEQRCTEFALGYGDSQRLVAMAHNVPTGTITPLWKAGTFRGTQWRPLLPRRKEEAYDELVRRGWAELAALLTVAESRELPDDLFKHVALAVDACSEGRNDDARRALEVFGDAAFKQVEGLGGEVVGELLVAAARAREAL
jgi:hypothetical protein